MHHMLGGVRHLVWDFGHGMEPGQRINMARFTLIGSVALTVLIWVVAFIAVLKETGPWPTTGLTPAFPCAPRSPA